MTSVPAVVVGISSLSNRVCEANLRDDEIAEVMGWSTQQVAGIRRTYVDRRTVVVAIADKLRGRL